MATLRDFKVGADSGSTASVSNSAYSGVTPKDWIITFGKHEGASASPGCTDNASPSSNGYNVRQGEQGHTNNDLYGSAHTAEVVNAATVSTVAFGGNRPWKEIHGYVVTPAAGKKLIFGYSVTAGGTQSGTSRVPRAGTMSIPASQPGIAIVAYSLYGTRTLTAYTGWTRPASQSGSALQSQYRTFTGSEGSIEDNSVSTPVNTLSASVEWVAQGVVLYEVDDDVVMPPQQPTEPLAGDMSVPDLGAYRLDWVVNSAAIDAAANPAVQTTTAARCGVRGDAATVKAGATQASARAAARAAAVAQKAGAAGSDGRAGPRGQASLQKAGAGGVDGRVAPRAGNTTLANVGAITTSTAARSGLRADAFAAKIGAAGSSASSGARASVVGAKAGASASQARAAARGAVALLKAAAAGASATAGPRAGNTTLASGAGITSSSGRAGARAANTTIKASGAPTAAGAGARATSSGTKAARTTVAARAGARAQLSTSGSTGTTPTWPAGGPGRIGGTPLASEGQRLGGTPLRRVNKRIG